MARSDLLAYLVSSVEAIRLPHPIRVAVDGPDAAGKTVLADELGEALVARGRAVIRASVDGFHRPRERYRRGPDSPEGYYEDSFDPHSQADVVVVNDHPSMPSWQPLDRERG
jgi:uridine kinase